jgi:hypothetical protein
MSEKTKETKVKAETKASVHIVQATKRGRKQRKCYHFVSKNADKYPALKDVKTYLDSFYDEIVYEDIVMRGGLGSARPVHRIWNFKQEDFVCPMCNKSVEVQFNIQPSGVYLRCWWCNVTFGPEMPVDPDKNEDRAILLNEEYVTPNEANKIVARIGTHRPYGLPVTRPRTRRRRKIS